MAAAIFAGGAMWYHVARRRSRGDALDSSEAHTLVAQPGQTARLMLDDSTRDVRRRLEAHDPEGLNTTIRAVKIEGAGRFSVAPGNPLPFEIRVGKAAVIATGTTITARAYPNDPFSIVQVDSGTATVRVGKEDHPLTAGQASDRQRRQDSHT